METTQKKRGRKPSLIKKMIFPIFINPELIEAAGGKKELRKKIYAFLQGIAVLALVAICALGDNII
jgi:hypothetical protein